MVLRLWIICLAIVLAACGARQSVGTAQEAPRQQGGIISLDFCADQYLLKLGDRAQIGALSPDSQKSFSLLAEAANGLPTIRPRAEIILAAKPASVIRSYGGDAALLRQLERTGVTIIQIPHADSLDSIRTAIIDTGAALRQRQKTKALINDYDGKLANAYRPMSGKTALYITSKGAVAGGNTLIGELISHAGFTNIAPRRSWQMVPMEQLARETPALLITGFFDTQDNTTDRWSPTRHNLIRRKMAMAARLDIPGAMTACPSWALADVATRLAGAHDRLVR